jgi:hypothetical protein
MRVLLLGTLGLPCEAMSSASIRDGGYGSFTAFAIYMTVICLVAGVSFFLGTQVGLMKDDYRRILVNQNLRKVLKLLKRVKATMTGIQEAEESAFLAEESEEEILEETESEIKARYKSSEMCEVSDSELWMHYNHGEASPSPDPSEEDPHDNEAALHSAMVETNGVLTARERRLLSEWNEAEARDDVVAMGEIENLLVEVRGLRYNN